MKPSRFTADFLSLGPVRAMVMSPAFPVVLQVLMLAVVLAATWPGLGVGPGLGEKATDIVRKTNLTTLTVWGLWWPAMVVTVLVLGRIWCTVCPLELLNRAGHTLARRLGLRGLRISPYLRRGWGFIAVYLVIQFLVAGAGLHHVPHYTALFILALVAGAFITGFATREPRAFCRTLCPAGALLSVYSRFTPVQLDIHDPDVCSSCPEKDCVTARNRYRFDARSCPSFIVPFRREPSDGCTLCFQCAKACPYGNIGFGVVTSDAPVRKKSLLRPFEAAFIFMEFGFVTHEMLEEVPHIDAYFALVPRHLAAVTFPGAFETMEAGWYLLVFPFLVWAIFAVAARLWSQSIPLEAGLAVATGAAPVVALAHATKGVFKIAEWGGYLPGALSDPAGLDVMHEIASTGAAPAHLMSLETMAWLALPVMLAMAWRAWKWAQDIPPSLWPFSRGGLILAAAWFTAILTAWTAGPA